MTTQNTQPKPALPIISEQQETAILDALRTLHGAVALYGSSPLPAFETASNDPAERERIAARSLKALINLHQHREEQTVAQFRQGVREVMASYVAEQSKAREAFLALPKEVRQFMPQFPTNVYVPLDAVSAVFPQGTPAEQQAKVLHKLGHKVSKKDKQTFIVAELPTK